MGTLQSLSYLIAKNNRQYKQIVRVVLYIFVGV